MSAGHDREPLPPSWFERNVGGITKGLIGFCGLLIGADLIFHFVGHKHVHFDAEAMPGFYALVGFASYVGLVLTAKQLRKLVMRAPDYYGEAPEPVPPEPRPQPQQDAARARGEEPAAEPPREPAEGEPGEPVARVRTDAGDIDEPPFDVPDADSDADSERER